VIMFGQECDPNIRDKKIGLIEAASVVWQHWTRSEWKHQLP